MIVIIRGAPSVGKTTVAAALLEQLENSALIEGDQSFPGMSDTAWHSVCAQDDAHRTSLRNSWIVAGVRALVERRLHAIVDSYFSRDYELPHLLQRLESLGQDIHVFILTVNPEEHLGRDATRPADWQIGERGIEHFMTHQESLRVPVGTVVDTSGCTAEKVAERILGMLNGNGQQTGGGDAEDRAPHP